MAQQTEKVKTMTEQTPNHALIVDNEKAQELLENFGFFTAPNRVMVEKKKALSKLHKKLTGYKFPKETSAGEMLSQLAIHALNSKPEVPLSENFITCDSELALIALVKAFLECSDKKRLLNTEFDPVTGITTVPTPCLTPFYAMLTGKKIPAEWDAERLRTEMARLTETIAEGIEFEDWKKVVKKTAKAMKKGENPFPVVTEATGSNGEEAPKKLRTTQRSFNWNQLFQAGPNRVTRKSARKQIFDFVYEEKPTYESIVTLVDDPTTPVIVSNLNTLLKDMLKLGQLELTD